jgi:DNA-binding CsgD family transcriptional regulator
MDLSDRQIECVMHLANGLRYEQIADAMGLSMSSVKQTVKRAQKNAGANTVPHLVSICIADGELIWRENERERALKPAPPAASS